jgi:hypothetical protein
MGQLWLNHGGSRSPSPGRSPGNVHQLIGDEREIGRSHGGALNRRVDYSAGHHPKLW